MKQTTTISKPSLPPYLIDKAINSAYGPVWKPEDVPMVIEAARAAGLLNIGGDLQFILPDGGICECYWIGVNPIKEHPKDIDWQSRVNLAAADALECFEIIKANSDFLLEGFQNYRQHLEKFMDNGGKLTDIMGFDLEFCNEEEFLQSLN